jgi:hypothetical protein
MRINCQSTSDFKLACSGFKKETKISHVWRKLMENWPLKSDV